MISWKLWQALNHPPRHHPLFQYTLTHAKKEDPKVAPGFFMWIFMCSTMTLIWTLIFDLLPYIFMTAIILLNTVYALRWTLRISGTIVAEKEMQRYDLLAALPIGMLGTSWAISTGCLHRRSSFRWLPYLMLMLAITTPITMIIMGLLTSFILTTDLNAEAILANVDLLEIAILIIPFMFAFYFDHLYSILTATLIGMVATVDVKDSTDARLRAAISFVTLQLVVYALLLTVLVLGLPQLFALLGLSGVLMLIIESIIGLVLFIAIREWLVRRMWRFLMTSFSAEENEVELVLQPSSV
ncbi:MAG: hypothetical protein Q9P01_17885 [Anaerolineae bacterium]|nr:hypothetical protein [Anaerolineae bacterium]